VCPTTPDVLTRLDVRLLGARTQPPLLFVPGYGGNQTMWRFLTPAFEHRHRIVLYDVLGPHAASLTGYRDDRYAGLPGYADDLLEICRALDLTGVTLVGHSVGAMIALLATVREPGRFAGLVMIGASPRYLDDGDYHGGFSRAAIDELLDAIDSNYLGWSSTIAPQAMATPERPDLADELTRSLTRVNPRVAMQFAEATFLSDHRADLAEVTVPTSVLQCRADTIVPLSVGRYLHRHIAGSTYEVLNGTGHFPHLSAPRQTTAAVRSFLDRHIAAPAHRSPP
jgi:sigma-B regulation protein RsbQ